MAQYKAKENFTGTEVSMCVGEVRDLTDSNIVSDLLRAGYIEEVKPAEKAETKRGAKK